MKFSDFSKTKDAENTPTLEEMIVKFTSSKVSEIENGDIYEFTVVNELINLLNQKYTCLNTSLETDFELHANKNCDKEPLYNGQIEIGNNPDVDLKNHLYKKAKNNEMNVSEKIKNQFIKLFSPKKMSKNNHMEM